MSLRFVQIECVPVPNVSTTQCNFILFGLTADGMLWSKRDTDTEWTRDSMTPDASWSEAVNQRVAVMCKESQPLAQALGEEPILEREKFRERAEKAAEEIKASIEQQTEALFARIDRKIDLASSSGLDRVNALRAIHEWPNDVDWVTDYPAEEKVPDDRLILFSVDGEVSRRTAKYARLYWSEGAAWMQDTRYRDPLPYRPVSTQRSSDRIDWQTFSPSTDEVGDRECAWVTWLFPGDPESGEDVFRVAMSKGADARRLWDRRDNANRPRAIAWVAHDGSAFYQPEPYRPVDPKDWEATHPPDGSGEVEVQWERGSITTTYRDHVRKRWHTRVPQGSFARAMAWRLLPSKSEDVDAEAVRPSASREIESEPHAERFRKELEVDGAGTEALLERTRQKIKELNEREIAKSQRSADAGQPEETADRVGKTSDESADQLPPHCDWQSFVPPKGSGSVEVLWESNTIGHIDREHVRMLWNCDRRVSDIPGVPPLVRISGWRSIPAPNVWRMCRPEESAVPDEKTVWVTLRHDRGEERVFRYSGQRVRVEWHMIVAWCFVQHIDEEPPPPYADDLFYSPKPTQRGAKQ